MKVRPRALAALLTRPVPERTPLIVEGLSLLVEHVAMLQRSVKVLADPDQRRSAMILEAVAGEEAAKALILVDLIRLGWRDQKSVNRQVQSFQSHLARGIYARVVDSSPASLGEVRELADRLRASHYLDGPNDVDWVFRNELEAAREGLLYVDYVQEEEGFRWHSPAAADSLSRFASAATVDLVLAMDRAGIFTERGLALTAREWNGVALPDSFGWPDVASRTHAIMSTLVKEQICRTDFTQEDWGRIQERWGFPLHPLDLSVRNVTDEHLQVARQAWLNAQS